MARKGANMNNIRRNENGGIEGLPLQLLIVVIIASVGIAVVLGWMGSIDEVKTIKTINVDPDGITVAKTTGEKTVTTFTVTVYDGDDNPIDNVALVLSGAGVTETAFTNQDGSFSWSNLLVTLPDGIDLGEISITAQKGDYGEKSTSVTVLRQL